jgi:hypothetical protein
MPDQKSPEELFVIERDAYDGEKQVVKALGKLAHDPSGGSAGPSEDRNAWPVVELSTPRQLFRLVLRLNRSDPLVPTFLFRGQALASWGLESSLRRLFRRHGVDDEETALSIERSITDYFISQAQLHGTRIDPQPFTAWPVMRHHGAPTRLLDWTSSLFVALYFACEGGASDDGAVWQFSRTALVDQLDWEARQQGKERDRYFDGWQRPGAENKAFVTGVPSHFVRTFVQQSDFTLNKKILGTDELALADTLDAASHRRSGGDGRKAIYYRKYIIPASAKLWMLRALYDMNISAVTLFPGLDGLGRATREMAALRSAFAVRREGLPAVTR